MTFDPATYPDLKITSRPVRWLGKDCLVWLVLGTVATRVEDASNRIMATATEAGWGPTRRIQGGWWRADGYTVVSDTTPVEAMTILNDWRKCKLDKDREQ